MIEIDHYNAIRYRMVINYSNHVSETTYFFELRPIVSSHDYEFFKLNTARGKDEPEFFDNLIPEEVKKLRDYLLESISVIILFPF